MDQWTVGILPDDYECNRYKFFHPFIHKSIVNKEFNLEGVDLNKQNVDLCFETNSPIPVALSVEIQLLSKKIDKVSKVEGE